MKAAEIRESFLKFFEGQGHVRVKSASLIPAADPTLLFTNAGMVQFKDCFLGLQNNGYSRATTCQKCVRAGGKHNDLENVGFTPRHHTFFEMLGNFSFGDYFKEKAIALAWDLLTKQWKLPKDKLWISVFEKDGEALELWRKQGIPAERIERLGEKDNFWAMGDTGPCGPCSEIHYDWGAQYGKGKSPGTDADGRFLEIWNLVFMQYNRDISGKLTPLPKPSVDTGAGLERLASVLQGKFSNYDTDVFAPILAQIQSATGTGEENASLRVIADHIRATTFLISDGVVPSNEGRGYVLRRILRRAIRHGKKLGQEKPFLYQLVKTVGDSLGKVYPDIIEKHSHIEMLVKEEEDKFHETLHRGLGLLETAIAEASKKKEQALSGDIAFKLYDTFGFPLDLTASIAAEHALAIDGKGFEALMEKQRSQSLSARTEGGAGKSGVAESIARTLDKKRRDTPFTGYESTGGESNLDILFDESGSEVDHLSKGSHGFAVFATTPFYAESGGQVGDVGTLEGYGCTVCVSNTRKNVKTFLHSIEVEEGTLKKGLKYSLQVDTQTRKRTAINHTATHMLHAALRKVLGNRVKQAGSLVDANRLRFDFTYPKGLSDEELNRVESMVNAAISEGHKVNVQELPFDEAMKKGALAFFDEKYGDTVRLVRVGEEKDPFSVELCGGTHLHTASDIALFKIVSESSVASGVRRIEAITADGAVTYLLDRHASLKTLERLLGTTDVVSKVAELRENILTLQKTNEKLQLQVAQGTSGGSQSGGQLWEKKVLVGDLQLVMERIPSVNPKIMRALVDQVRDKLKERAVVVLACETEGKVALCLGLTSDLTGRYNACALIQPLAKDLGGTGGGRPDFAQAGGTHPDQISEAFEKFRGWLQTQS